MASRLTDGIKSILKRKQSSVQEDDDPSIQEYLRRSARRGNENAIEPPTTTTSILLDREKHEMYNNLLLSVYEEDKSRLEEEKECDSLETTDQANVLNQTDFVELFRQFAIEHENILQFLIVLPLLLMVFYIVVIEKSPVYRYIDEKKS